MTEVDTHRRYGKEYFDYLDYSKKRLLIKSHLWDTLKWGSKTLHANLFDGKGKSALIVGCAFGYEVELLSSLGYDTLGTDISVYGVRHAKRDAKENDFIVCDAQKNFPFKKKFSLITCFEVLEHLANPLSALKNMYESCNSVILCTTPNKAIERVVKKVLRNFDKTHINVKTPKQWEKQIHNNLKCQFVRIESSLDIDFKIANKQFFTSFRLPFGMNTRILIKK